MGLLPFIYVSTCTCLLAPPGNLSTASDSCLTRKRVRPYPARRLAWRRVSHHSSDRHSSLDFTSDSSSSSSSSDSLSDFSSGFILDSLSETSSVMDFRMTPLIVVRLYALEIAPALDRSAAYKRFKDSYSSEVSGEEHMEMGTTDAETVADLGISEGVGAHTKDGVDLGVEVATSDIREDEEEFEALASAGGTMEVAIDPLVTSNIFDPAGGDCSCS
ncbi:hypothetical protein Tco_1191817 [Tanacetum coccineum]